MSNKTGGYSRIKATARLKRKQNEADKRQAVYEVLSTAEKLARLPLCGESKREIARLQKRLAANK
jgi:hypothetical protein